MRIAFRLVAFNFSIFAFSAAPVAQASIWSCLCNLTKRDCDTKVVPPATHQNAYWNLMFAKIGVYAKLELSKETVEGVIIEANFDGIVLGTKFGDKVTTKFYPHKKIEGLNIGRAKDAFELDPAQARVAKRQLEARQKYLEFLNTDYIGPQRDSIIGEVRRLRAMKGGEARETYVKGEAGAVIARIKHKFGITNIGFHYNLNGGVGRDYIDGGGLKISRGDVALQYSRHGDFAEKIYIFQSAHETLYNVLSATNPKLLVGGRMGSELNVINLDHQYFEKARSEGGIPKENEISFDFEPAWLAKQDFNSGVSGLVGIPYATYLAPPVQVFQGFRKQLPELGRLSRVEETLVTLRQLEAILVSKESFLPSE